jgi:uncharacterized protein (TIGR02231 family)
MRARNWSWLVVGLAVASAAMAAAPPEAPGVRGKVEAVTLYRGQAMVTRAVPVDGAAGRVELVVADLPEQIVPDSLFAEGGQGIEIRAVRFRTRAVGEEPREEVRKLEQETELAQDKIARNKRMQELITQKIAFLGKLEGFTAPTATMELSRGVLDFDALKQVTLFGFDERQKAAEEALKLDTEARDLAKQLALLQRQRAELAAGASKTVREAIVFLEKRGAEKGTLKLSYLVSQAGWMPAYNFRSAKDGKQVRVEYNALVQQMSGEGWDAVALTLSTASPVLGAQGPGLAPFRVVLAPGQPQTPAAGKDIAAKYQVGQKRLQEFAGRQQAASSLRDNRAFNWDMNAAANDFQWVELAAGREVLDALRGEPGLRAEGPSIAYALPSPVSLASRADQQMLRIADVELASRFYYVAVPILTSYVYREAELTNTGVEALLAGPVSVYLDSRFVGRGEIPTVAKGETFVMGFGADPQIRARRELLDKTEAVQGGNREVTLKYRLLLENYKEEAVKVRLLDRLPYPERKTDVRVTAGEMTEKLSDDKLYARLEQPKGILRWDIEVAARAAGETAKTVEFSYKMEHDRSLVLTTPAEGKAGELQREFEEMQERRLKF